MTDDIDAVAEKAARNLEEHGRPGKPHRDASVRDAIEAESHKPIPVHKTVDHLDDEPDGGK